MAEPTESHLRNLCETWLPELGSAHGTTFDFCGVAEPGGWCDFFVRDEAGEQIPVQHTRAVRDAEQEIVYPKNAGRIVALVQERLESLRGMHVSFDLDAVPKDRGEQDRLADSLGRLIWCKAFMAEDPVVFRFERGDAADLARVEQYVSFIEVRSAPEFESVALGYGRGYSTRRTASEATIVALNSHPGNFHDVILLVESAGHFPTYEMGDFSSEVETRFREAWIVESGYPPNVSRLYGPS